MKYLIMECHKGYAIALDEDGRFLRVANMNYQVGQTTEDVLCYREETHGMSKKKIITFLFTAACFCLLVIGCWYNFLMPYGSVQMQINPDVTMTVNRMNYVTGMEAGNDDGEILLEDYHYRGKQTEKVLMELVERAEDMEYLSTGGTVYLKVEGKNDRWVKEKQNQYMDEIRKKVGSEIQVSHGDKKSVLKPQEPSTPGMESPESHPADGTANTPSSPANSWSNRQQDDDEDESSDREMEEDTDDHDGEEDPDEDLYPDDEDDNENPEDYDSGENHSDDDSEEDEEDQGDEDELEEED